MPGLCSSSACSSAQWHHQNKQSALYPGRWTDQTLGCRCLCFAGFFMHLRCEFYLQLAQQIPWQYGLHPVSAQVSSLRHFTGAGGQRSCKATMVCHSDPHLPYVPSPVMHFVLRTLAPFAFRQMHKVCSAPALLASCQYRTVAWQLLKKAARIQRCSCS